jgi:hypothetical protein
MNANTLLSDLTPETLSPERTEQYINELAVTLATKAAECSIRAIRAATGAAENLSDDDHASLNLCAKRLNRAARILAGLED